MNTEQQKAKIIACIEGCGWFTTEIYQTAAQQLCDNNIIKLAHRHTATGRHVFVWVKA